jgi:hypothetical protein
MPIAYEVIATTGTYTNKSGEEKKRWQKIGVVMQTKNGLALKMESVPVNWDGWATLAEPKQRDNDAPF